MDIVLVTNRVRTGVLDIIRPYYKWFVVLHVFGSEINMITLNTNKYKKYDQCTSVFHFADWLEAPYEVDL